MNYRDIIGNMERSGHYGEARELQESMRDHGVSESDRISNRDDARDGLSYGCYAASLAERAYDDIKGEQRREEQRREDERRQEIEYAYHQQRQQEAEWEQEQQP